MIEIHQLIVSYKVLSTKHGNMGTYTSHHGHYASHTHYLVNNLTGNQFRQGIGTEITLLFQFLICQSMGHDLKSIHFLRLVN